MEATVYWLTSLAALVAVWLNIHRRVACFVIWSVTNTIWVYADLTHGIYPQAALQFVYFLMALYRVYKWRQDSKDDSEDEGQQ